MEVIVAIISGLCVAIPSIISTVIVNNRNKNLLIYRVGSLEEKVGKHNNLIDRMYKVESRVTVLEDEIRRW